jgi:hypothetical protein
MRVDMISRNKVDFIVCGTQKGGTSALDSYLRIHPEICMAEMKEVHFFDNEDHFTDNNTIDYNLYHGVFDQKVGNRVSGEATPIYMYWHETPKRIWEYNPDMKLIIILRNPIERAYSHWNMECARGADNISFWDALVSERDRSRQALPYQHRVYSYIDRGFYSEQLRRLWAFFPQEQILILKNEALRFELQKTLYQICEFLTVSTEPFLDIDLKEVYATPYKTLMSKKEKDYLRSEFEFEIKNLERMLGWDCADWL